MSAGIFLGDELTGLGYRLAGFGVRNPEPAAAAATLREALAEEPEMVVVTAELARHLDAAQLAGLRKRARPLVAVVPDLRGEHRPADQGERARRILGIADR